MKKEELIDKIKKLHALAQRGEKGEAQNAERLMNRMMEIHGIDASALDDTAESIHEFIIDTSTLWLFSQLTELLMGKKNIYGHSKKKTHFFILCTPAQAVELSAMYSHYNREWGIQQRLFRRAFLGSNDLLIKVESMPDQLSNEDIELNNDSNHMASIIKSNPYKKQLEAENQI